MKIWGTEHTFNHPWETMAQATWKKYPNPMNPAVIGIDVLERKVNNGILHTHRLVSTKFGLPAWVYSLMGKDETCYVSEYSEVDPNKKTMTLKSRNLTLCNYLSVDEKLTYSQHPTEADRTVLKHEAIVTVHGIPLNSYLESAMTNTISVNAGKGRQAMEWVISKLNAEVHELTTNAVKSMDELTTNAVKSMDELTTNAVKSMDEITLTTKKSMDDISRVAQKSVDNLQNLSPSSKLPEL